MADIIVKVMRNGEPVKDADVTVAVMSGAGSGKALSGIDGRAITKEKAGGPVLCYIQVKRENFAMGGGPYEVTPGEEFVIEV